jgi:hypothetical protein
MKPIKLMWSKAKAPAPPLTGKFGELGALVDRMLATLPEHRPDMAGVAQALAEIEARPFAPAMEAWIRAKQDRASLPRGVLLRKIVEWGRQRDDLTRTELDFVSAASRELEGNLRRSGAVVTALALAFFALSCVSLFLYFEIRKEKEQQVQHGEQLVIIDQLKVERDTAVKQRDFHKLQAEDAGTEAERLRLLAKVETEYRTVALTARDRIQRVLNAEVFAHQRTMEALRATSTERDDLKKSLDKLQVNFDKKKAAYEDLLHRWERGWDR